jgi:1-acyl-sn-glycerol-3-phosphate acyltransferase
VNMWALGVAALLLVWFLASARRSGQPLTIFAFLQIARGYARLWHRGSSNGRAPLPAAGPALLYANHTCSADPMFLLGTSPRPLSFLASQEHYEMSRATRFILDTLRSVPVTRSGRDVGAARQALRRLDEGCVLCVFPEGNLSALARGRPGKPKLGLAYLALKRRVPVYPARIVGGPHTHRLLDSWVRPARVPVRVIYGPPVDLSAYHGRRLDRRLLAEVSHFLMCHLETLQPKEKAHE